MLRKRGYNPDDPDFSAVSGIASMTEYEFPEVMDMTEEALSAIERIITDRGRVPENEMKSILESGSKQCERFGKAAVNRAWKKLVTEGFVKKKNGVWKWVG
jgi:hypothetical protein